MVTGPGFGAIGSGPVEEADDLTAWWTAPAEWW